MSKSCFAIAVLLAACSSASEVASESPPASSPIGSALESPPENTPENTPEPAANEAVAPSVALEGYGITLALNPPFVVNRLSQGREGQLIHAHEDGERFRNLMVIPGAATEDAELRRTMVGPLHMFQVGEEGTRVILPPEVTSLDGIAVLTLGPADESWTIVSDGERTPWPPGKHLQSPSRAAAPGFELIEAVAP